MLLEDETVPAEFRGDLEKIHAGGRQLLSLIKDYFDEESFAQKRPGLHQLHHELRTPVNHIVGYTELLEEFAEERGLPLLWLTWERSRQAAHTWLDLIKEYLVPPAADAGAHVHRNTGDDPARSGDRLLHPSRNGRRRRPHSGRAGCSWWTTMPRTATCFPAG